MQISNNLLIDNPYRYYSKFWEGFYWDNFKWFETDTFKGQLHCHTTNSDGADSPLDIVNAYKNAGYDFISITDHDVITPSPNVSGITFIQSVEKTMFRHITAYDVDNQYTGQVTQEAITHHYDKGKICSLAHSNWPGNYVCSKEELNHYYNLSFMEIYNATICTITNQTVYAEEQWDQVLSEGKKVYALTVDDCHNINILSQFNRAWVMVNAESNTKDNILASIRAGNFYCSTGNDIMVSVMDNVIIAQSPVNSDIQFIGRDGVVLKCENGVQVSTYTIKGHEKYVRIKAINTQDNTKMAWSNPIFIKKL